MESKSYLMKADEFANNQTKECPYCNAIIPLSEYDDHIFCHQVDGEENGQSNFDINNFGLQSNNNNSSINNNNNFSNNSNPQDNNINQPYINPESRRINSINVINENNNNNQNNNQINQNNNNQNNNNINNNNNESKVSESFIDKIKNYFIPSNNNNENNNQNKRDIMSLPYEELTIEERAERSRIEEQKAYEKKILGIANSESSGPKASDPRSTGEKISDFVTNNSGAILATIDIIGCLTLHTPSIGRTIMRVGNLIGQQYNNFTNRNNDNNSNDNDNGDNSEYNNLIREHPELKRKNKDVETIIKFLPVSEIKEIKFNQNNNSNNKCIICLSEFEIGDQVSALPCCHVFHTDCIVSWLKKHCQCPVCKFDITLKSLIGGV